MNKIEFTHIAGSILIQAKGAFLNGMGKKEGEVGNYITPKSYKKGNKTIFYVSAQSWRKWLRNTMVEDNNWESSEQRKVGDDQVTTALDPIKYAEDDLFGYMWARLNTDKIKDKEKKTNAEKAIEDFPVRSIQRSSPFMTSILRSIESIGGRLPVDKAFVHPPQGDPVPYTTDFYDSDLEAVFCLDFARIGTFRQIGDRIELSDDLIEKHKNDLVLEEIGNKKVFKLKNKNTKIDRAIGILNAIVALRGGAKQAAFGTDVSPKFVVLAGLDCGNPIFNNLFEEEEGKPMFKIETFKEVIKDYESKIKGNIYLGIRKGYLKNEEETKEAFENHNKVKISSPMEAVKAFTKEYLKDE